MKKIVILIGVASLAIVICMLCLVKWGISLTPAVLITPSHFENDDVIAAATVQRLFPQLSENKNWKVVNTTPESASLTRILIAKLRHDHAGIELLELENSDDVSTLSAMTEPQLYVQMFSEGDYALTEECSSMKRLNYKCLVEVSLHKSRRKMKEDGLKYFLMTSYLEKHYLLLIEK